MTVGFIGKGTLAKTLALATQMRGMDATMLDFSTRRPEDCSLVFVAVDVLDHGKLDEIDAVMVRTLGLGPTILVSQVPPGYTRKWRKRNSRLYYQVDTLIINRALERAVFPERIIVGCDDCEVGVKYVAYLQWLELFNCPILKMSYESAEFVKLAINQMLADQIASANRLSKIAKHVGADWDHVEQALRLDGRIGQAAYIHPGGINQHLKRDTDTLEKIEAAWTQQAKA